MKRAYLWSALLFSVVCAALVIYRPEVWVPVVIIWVGIMATFIIRYYRSRS